MKPSHVSYVLNAKIVNRYKNMEPAGVSAPFKFETVFV